MTNDKATRAKEYSEANKALNAEMDAGNVKPETVTRYKNAVAALEDAKESTPKQ